MTGVTTIRLSWAVTLAIRSIATELPWTETRMVSTKPTMSVPAQKSCQSLGEVPGGLGHPRLPVVHIVPVRSIEPKAVRIVLVNQRTWQVRIAGDGWPKSIHHPDAAFVPIDPELLDKSQRLAAHCDLETVGSDDMVAADGTRHLLEVNHVPQVTVLGEVRLSILDLVVDWAGRGVSDRRTPPMASSSSFCSAR